MDEEYQQKKTELDSELDKKQAEVKEQIAELDKSVRKAKSAADEEIAEYNAELHKKRVREADEYKYNEKMNRRQCMSIVANIAYKNKTTLKFKGESKK